MKVKTPVEILAEVLDQFISIALVVGAVLVVWALYVMGEVSGTGALLWVLVVALIAWYGRGRCGES